MTSADKANEWTGGGANIAGASPTTTTMLVGDASAKAGPHGWGVAVVDEATEQPQGDTRCVHGRGCGNRLRGRPRRDEAAEWPQGDDPVSAHEATASEQAMNATIHSQSLTGCLAAADEATGWTQGRHRGRWPQSSIFIVLCT